jgi:2-oxoglutarate dehydrogenase E2 component (dihydrolipoamide succinyltransferase)
VKAEIKVPTVGESITEATIGEWTKKSGEFVKRDEIILLLDTDKASVEVTAPNDGVITMMAKAGETVKIGAVVALIDTEGVATAGMKQPAQNIEKTAPAAAAATGATQGSPSASVTAAAGGAQVGKLSPDMRENMSPAVARVAGERGLDPSQIAGTGKDGRITKQDALAAVPAAGGLGATAANTANYSAQASATTGAAAGAASGTQSGAHSGAQSGLNVVAPKKTEIPPLPTPRTVAVGARGQRRQAMSTIRKRISERLVMSQQTTATLTTFNEVDMTAVLALREKYKDKYKEKYGVSLGFMGFFVKACVEALRELPQVNAFIDGSDLIFNDAINIGVAVGTEKGLIVPVVRDADFLTVAGIEQAIRHYALKARDGKISVDDLSGGTFTISNGGVYGSLMSTPILNPPQSGILGMHKIEERAVVINGKIEVRHMMYLALSYDHRVIDGKEAVTFLVRVKEGIEDPSRLLLEI